MAMTKEEYDAEKARINLEQQKAIKALNIKFSHENNPIKIGDVVSDHSTTIRVEKIITHKGVYKDYPECVYEGVQLLKNGSIAKRQNDTRVYQSGLKTINGVDVK